ncbi:MAG: hypothetical protein KKF62_17960 [Bacteroidetes bacterium]|nr:hypothetical protein [Bacteroidota bacterium]MBU1115316.1 hypothetical protein [Bacteroidota bacterium]MBU1800364.1 hypothetical protein [Bacteroidota bacterium]
MSRQKKITLVFVLLFTSTVFSQTIWTSTGTSTDISYDGKVGIGTGTSTLSEKLTVNGTVYAKEIIIDLNVPVPDYVFEDDYKLMSLMEIEEFVKKHKHLPEIPSAAEVESNGLSIGEMQTNLLKKIEELTLYMIEQEKTLEKLESEISSKKTN